MACLKWQRVELQRLRAHRDVEVASLVQGATQRLKDELEKLKGLLHSTSCQLLQTVAEKEKVVADNQQALVRIEELKNNAEVAQHSMASRLQAEENSCMQTSGTLTTLADSVERFQRHVLPTFKPQVPNNLKPTHKVSAEPGTNQFLMNEVQTTIQQNFMIPSTSCIWLTIWHSYGSSWWSVGRKWVCLVNVRIWGPYFLTCGGVDDWWQLARLESGLQLLQVIVDAKNDTLVLIRGKVRQVLSFQFLCRVPFLIFRSCLSEDKTCCLGILTHLERGPCVLFRRESMVTMG